MKLSDEQNRLTKRIFEHVYYTRGVYSETLPIECTPQDVREILKRLADYEDIGTLYEINLLLSSEQTWIEENVRLLARIAELEDSKGDYFDSSLEPVEGTSQRWSHAIDNARFMLEEYRKIPVGIFGAMNISSAINRYENGERTEYLLEELESIQ